MVINHWLITINKLSLIPGLKKKNNQWTTFIEDSPKRHLRNGFVGVLRMVPFGTHWVLSKSSNFELQAIRSHSRIWIQIRILIKSIQLN